MRRLSNKGEHQRNLNDRQRKVLYCIVKEYIENKKPVSSQRVLEVSNINFSSATIRNDMKKLEYLGYIYQPHTSAGRVPTDKGLRFYYEEMVKLSKETEELNLEVDTFRSIPLADPEKVLLLAGNLLARLAEGYVLIERPNPRDLKILRVMLIPVSEDYLIFSILTEFGISKITPIRIHEDLNWEEIERQLNFLLRGRTVEDVLTGKVETLRGSGILKLIESVMNEKLERYIDVGFENLLKDDTLSLEDIKHLLEEIRDHRFLESLIENDKDVTVKIGKEIGSKKLERFAVFSGRYYKGSSPIGSVHLFTSKITRYDRNHRVFNYVLNRLSEYFTSAARR
ncbi:HrcA family transcriptional regulator [Thermotoga sp. RQ7]|uniref:heat-inducible transcriptional repressor HrcA n=1 Tax=Thermotoga sp. RQ7 TaxID=126738 RepID=UPI0005A31334|nr:heat-inducible transcriptional repressor HrcA [Thermotoga sp. RQ7]AJG39931.1 HrcA family transcriptional regulator [Thermotoga sp. RQ7]MDK2785343.1 heat-inducible transcriptional repressor [Thermotoga sp.]MDK2950122.1 heat-inducible transcriptional repressor [Thermotoga sp.]